MQVRVMHCLEQSMLPELPVFLKKVLLVNALHQVLIHCRLTFLDMTANYLRFPNSVLPPTVPLRVCSIKYRVKPNSAISRRHFLRTLCILSSYSEPNNNSGSITYTLIA